MLWQVPRLACEVAQGKMVFQEHRSFSAVVKHRSFPWQEPPYARSRRASHPASPPLPAEGSGCRRHRQRRAPSAAARGHGGDTDLPVVPPPHGSGCPESEMFPASSRGLWQRLRAGCGDGRGVSPLSVPPGPPQGRGSAAGAYQGELHCCPLPMDIKVIILMKSSPFPQVPPG